VAKPADIAFLRQVDLLRDLEEEQLIALWPRLRERRLRKGEVLFREGDPGEEMFFIRTGAILVSKKVSGRVEQILSRLEPGAIFGEMSVFGDEPKRTATIQADVETHLLALDRVSVNEFIDANPRDAARFFQEMVRVLIRRLVQSSDLVREVTRWGLEATGLDAERKSASPPA
jgi:CRP/FNR family transcriptional regulator, cyclic AMP receptor protein